MVFYAHNIAMESQGACMILATSGSAMQFWFVECAGEVQKNVAEIKKGVRREVQPVYAWISG